MASELAIKRANHREQMETLDRQHDFQMRSRKEAHRNQMDRLRNKQSNEKQELQQNQKHQLETIKRQNDSFVHSEKVTHQNRLEKQKQQAQVDYQRAAAEKARSNARLRTEAQVEKERQVALKEQHRAQSMEQKQAHERNLESMDKESRFRLGQKQDQYQKQEQSLQSEHRQELAKIDQDGQKYTKEKRDKYTDREIKQRKIHRDHLEKNQKHYQMVKDQQREKYGKELQKEEKFFQGQITDQRTEYKKRFQENETQNTAIFENQENRLAEEMFKIRKDFITEAKFYEDRKQDPFYSLVDFGAQFKEGEAFYEVTAQIPEHEMKNVRVHVQPNKISLHAARQHEQELKDENEKIGSNISQTIRQEFELAKPVDFSKAVKNYNEGILTITVPKKGYYEFGKGIKT